MFLCSVLSALCLFSVWCLSVSCFQSSVRCSLSINRAQVSSDRANCIPRVGGLRSPEASMLARVIAYGTWRREIMFMHLMWENSSLLISITCSVLDVKSHLSQQHILNQLETAVLDSTHSMHQLEVLGASLLLKLLVTDLWTLLWTILFIHPMWESSSLLILLTCSVLDVKSRLSRQHILNQLETAVLDSIHTTHKRLRQDEVQL